MNQKNRRTGAAFRLTAPSIEKRTRLVMLNQMYNALTYDIRHHPDFLKLKNLQHHKRDIYHHVLRVSYTAFKWAFALRLDYKAVARAGLLHDFFIYDWRKDGRITRKPFFEKHGFTHAREACENAKARFELSALERDIILHHMFPLTPRPPNSKEGWLINLTDKVVTVAEYVKP